MEWLLALAQIAAEAPPTVPPPADIVVVARERRCDVSIANRLISTAEFNKRATEWATGVPVRVRVPSDADLPCMYQIARKLGQRGVRRIVFLTPGQE